jgi:hypothetical protein
VQFQRSGGTETGRGARLNFPPIDPVKADLIVFELRKVAAELDSTPAQVALAWVLGRSEATSVIIGARTEGRGRAASWSGISSSCPACWTSDGARFGWYAGGTRRTQAQTEIGGVRR